MRPTFSIIAFTLLSGTGYGLWFLLGIGFALSRAGGADTPWPAFVAAGLLLGLALVGTGLFASLGHLGKPSRAWRALSQWRSSWLSREGIAALSTFVPALALAATAFGLLPASTARLCGFALASGAFATVWCTAHIYSSLTTVRAWNHPLVVSGYVLLGLYGGLLALWLLAAPTPFAPRLAFAAMAAATYCAAHKLRYWRSIDGLPSLDAGNATGLARFGAVRSLEQPHTEENYLLHEMGFVLARKHARKLRAIGVGLAFAAPALLALIALAAPRAQFACAALGLAAGLAGLFVERWLFFAEAKHAVTAYYGR